MQVLEVAPAILNTVIDIWTELGSYLRARKAARKNSRRSQCSDSYSNESCESCVCDSTEDVITLDKLEKVHVCWKSPDLSNKMCFNISTLIKIGARSNADIARKVALDGDATKVLSLFPWRQPPHFRTDAENDIKAQLESRFGAEKLLGFIKRLVHVNVECDDIFEEEYVAWQERTMSTLEFVRMPYL